MTPRVLLLGGLDPSGGAGITLDAAVVGAHGGAPLPIALALTEQGLRGFRRAHPTPETQWRGALDAVLADGPAHAIKIGFVPDVATAHALAAALAPLAASIPLVLDPVLSATAGGYAGADALAAALREGLAARAALVTPNLPELALLAAGDPRALLAVGARAVLAKGGHGDGADSVDVLWSAGGRRAFARPRLPTGRVRGTGCALACAIAVQLARGTDPAAACAAAGDWLHGLLAALGPASDAGLPRTLPFDRLAPAAPGFAAP